MTDVLSRRFYVVLLILIIWSGLLGPLRHTSATYDEHEYISRGYLNLKTGETQLMLRHPILLGRVDISTQPD
jgi:hypothetical protein